MKKSLFFAAAASALMLTACSSESDVVQNTAPQTQTTVQQKAVGFDTYTAGTTRAGLPEGVMTTDKLKTAGNGFGVFAMYQDNGDYTSTLAPNFMFNEHIHWTLSGGWTYSPLKYWPNETTHDSQTDPAVMPGPTTPGTNIDKLSFFAYAPYVSTGAGNTLDTKADNYMVATYSAPGTPATYYDKAWKGTEASGILSMSAENRSGDPLVEWKYSTDLDKNVDLLWGVAPAGMSYTDVSGSTTTATTGLPLLDMVKPNKDQKMKFLFQHALSRIGLSVVSAIDQIAAGDDGDKYKNAQTRVLIKSVEVYGNFGKQGVLNLNNTTPLVANWIGASVDKADVDGAALFTFDNGVGVGANGYIAPDLRYVTSQINAAKSDADDFDDINTGVLPSEQTLLAGGADPSKKVESATPAFEYNKVLYVLSGTDYVMASTTASEVEDAYTKSGDEYTQVFATDGSSKAPLNGKSAQLYKVSATTAVAYNDPLTDGTTYWVKSGSAGNWVYTKHVQSGAGTADAADKYYTDFAPTELGGAAYGTGEYYTDLMPRYFMVVPTSDTNIKVKITYAVVTKDEKLGDKLSDVENVITKATSINLKSGKSYKLKLILGLTSVKMEATVADWQVADDTEIWLPKNN